MTTTPTPRTPIAQAAGEPVAITEKMLNAGLMALVQCTASELEDYSPKLMEGYIADVTRVFTAMQIAAPSPSASSVPVAVKQGAFHTGVIVKSLLDEAFLILRPNSPEDCPEEPHMRVALGKKFWGILPNHAAPQANPAPSVLTDEQISAIVDEFDACSWIDGECRIEGRDMVKLCRALLQANGATK
jgi:hypothetical protein